MDKPITIKTLSEILADMDNPVSAKTPKSNDDTPKPAPPTNKPPKAPSPKPKKAPTPKKPSAVSQLLGDGHQSVLDDNSLKLLSQVEIEALTLPNKQTRYLRWLAFYYLSRRELSRHELRAKLIAKDCNPLQIDELLIEFADKGYQSDERCATMLVREAVRKGRGIHHIKDSLKKAGLDAKDFGGLDELIARSGETLTDGTVLEGGADEIDWLKLAVEARCKKYGDTPPKDPKDKARQLRFLQYRGFEMDVCFEALKMTLKDFAD